MTKNETRKTIKAQRHNLSQKVVQDLSATIQAKVLQLPIWPETGNIALYSDIKNEVQTHLLFQKSLESGLHVFFPRVEQGIKFYEVNGPDDLQKGCWGILEPKLHCQAISPDETFDLIICPGIAFTKDCYRLGYGRGFYDKLLTEHEVQGCILGLAYDFQIIDSFKQDDWDKPVNAVVTESCFYSREK